MSVGHPSKFGCGYSKLPDLLKTQIQLCIVHMVRNPLKFVPLKDYREVTKGLKIIYQAVTEEAALLALESFAEKWGQSTL